MSADYTIYTDGELIQFLQNNDEKAFTELYSRYWDKLFFLAGKKINDLYEAQHIVQDVFLDLWNRRSSLEIKGAVDGYLVVAVKYRIINLQAKRDKQAKREKLVMLQTPEAENPTEKWMDFEELLATLNDQLSRLPEKCGLAFNLRQEGLSYREIADTMDISEKTVQMHITRALKALRGNLRSLLSFLSVIG